MLMSESYLIDNAPKVLETFRDAVSVIEFWDNGIVFFRINDNAEVQLENSQFHFNTLLSRFDGKNKFRVLVETGEHATLSKEAREYASVPERTVAALGTAVIVKSIAHRLIINFIIKVMPSHANVKMRMFDKKEKAIEWLLAL